jgi:hypothetical protein
MTPQEQGKVDQGAGHYNIIRLALVQRWTTAWMAGFRFPEGFFFLWNNSSVN